MIPSQLNSMGTFTAKVNELFIKRQMMPRKKTDVAIKSFYEHFRGQSWYYHCVYGDGFEMLDILLDDSLLLGGEQFNKNFYSDILQQPALLENKTWQSLMPSLITHKGERVGAGEFYFPFVVQGWVAPGGTSDGFVAGGKREIKFKGASLKPIANSQHRVIDRLIQTVFNGNRPGPSRPGKKSNGQSFDRWHTWLNAQPNKEQVLLTFFKQLYPGRDVDAMCKELIAVNIGENACENFYRIVGTNVLGWYKEIDQWNSLVLIDLKLMKVANIANTNDLSMFDIKFNWVTKRENNKGSGSGDVRQHADGYVNISLINPIRKQKSK